MLAMAKPLPTYPTSNFHPLEAVSRYRDPQLKVGENYSHLFGIKQLQILMLILLRSQ